MICSIGTMNNTPAAGSGGPGIIPACFRQYEPHDFAPSQRHISTLFGDFLHSVALYEIERNFYSV